MCGGQITVKNWWNLPISNPKPDLFNIYAHTKFGKKYIVIYSSYHPEMKYQWTDRWAVANGRVEGWADRQMDRHRDAQCKNIMRCH